MKLRLQPNSIRVRLSPDEVDQLTASGLLVDEVRFGDGPNESIVYALEVHDGDRLVSSCEGGRITVKIPRGRLAKIRSEDGLHSNHPAGSAGSMLETAVEEDLKPFKGKRKD